MTAVPGTEAHKQVVRDFLAAIGDRRLADLPEYMARDVVDHNKIHPR